MVDFTGRDKKGEMSIENIEYILEYKENEKSAKLKDTFVFAY